MEVQLFVPCFIDQLYPETAFNTISVLERVGCKVHYNPNQTCCGQPAFNSGYWPEAAQLANKFMNDFSESLPVVSPSASCSGFIQHQYPKLLTDHTVLGKHKILSTKIFELSDFLVNVLKVETLDSFFPHTVTYHDACSALREGGIKLQPRKLLSMVKGLELVEMTEAEVCCGFGGTFAVKHAAISTAMAEKKVINAMETGASYIVSTEASCLMQINAYATKHKLPVKGIHLADILASK